MNATVLGGNGFIGSHLTRHLRAQGFDVWVPTRDDETILVRPLGHVFYCIGLTSDFRSRPFATVEAHVTLLSAVLEKAKFDSLLYLSSTRVYARAENTAEADSLCVAPQDASDLYNLSKLLGESLCHASCARNVRVARLSNVVGPNMGTDSFVGSVFASAQSGHISLQTHPDSEKDYIHVDDVVQLLLLIAKGGLQNCYNLASGKQIRHSEWLVAMRDVFRCTIDISTDAPSQSFRPINVDRICTEFGFKAKDVLNSISCLTSV